MLLIFSEAPPSAANKPFDVGLQDYLLKTDYVVAHINEPVEMAHISHLFEQSDQQIVVESPGSRLTNVLAKHQPSQVRALGMLR